MQSDAESILAGLSRIAGQVDVHEGDLKARLDEIVGTASTIFAVAGAGLMLYDDRGELRLVGATDDTGRALERIQQETGEGPGVDSCRLGRQVVVVDMTVEARWPKFTAAAVALGVSGVLSAPIWARDRAVGNLNLFDTRPHEWSKTERAGLDAFAGAAGAVIRISVESAHRGRLVEQLQELLLNGDLPRRADDPSPTADTPSDEADGDQRLEPLAGES